MYMVWFLFGISSYKQIYTSILWPHHTRVEAVKQQAITAAEGQSFETGVIILDSAIKREQFPAE